MKSKREVTAT